MVRLSHLASEAGWESCGFGLFHSLDEVAEPVFADLRGSPPDAGAVLGLRVIASTDVPEAISAATRSGRVAANA